MTTSPQPLPNTNDADEPAELMFLRRQAHTDPEMLRHFRAERLIQIISDTAAEVARLEALQIRAIAELRRRRRHDPSTASEVALALSITEKRAATLVSEATALTSRLPRTLALMDRGTLDLYRASKVVRGTNWLTDELAGIVDVVLESRVPNKNAEQIRKATNYASTKAAGDGGARRAAQRRDERKVRLHHTEVGTSHVSIVHAPAEKATAAFQRIDKVARQLKAEGELRSLDQLRSDVALDLLLSANGGAPERAEVLVYIDLATYLGLNTDPAELAGYGAIPASIAQRIISGPDTTVRRIITNPLTGQITELGRDRHKITKDTAEFVQVRDQQCRQPGCARPAQTCAVTHTEQTGTDKLSNAEDLISYCSRHLRLKDRPGWHYAVEPDGTLRVTTPADQAHDSTPPPLHPPRRQGKRQRHPKQSARQ